MRKLTSIILVFRPQTKPKKPYKRPPHQKKKKDDNLDESSHDLSTEDESDGQTALRKVEAAEAKKRTGGSRGPQNINVKHFHSPKPIVNISGTMRWSFACTKCTACVFILFRYIPSCLNMCIMFSVRTVPRTIKDGAFGDEPKQPRLGNLATHIKEAHPKLHNTEPSHEAGQHTSANSTHEHGYSAASVKLMADYLEEGRLNPKVFPSQKGFLKVFAAWILQEDLPWNTGEAPSLKTLFEFLDVRYMLPTDTTVRNTLAEIFADLHGEVVKELAVRVPRATKNLPSNILTARQIQDCLHGRYLDDSADGVFICGNACKLH